MNNYMAVSDDVKLGRNVKLSKFVNLYGCHVGDNTKIGAFVEIQKNARVGRSCKISSHTFICEGVTIDDGCFIGHGVMFINDNYPQAVNSRGRLESEKDWSNRLVKTHIGKGVAIGSNATILGGISIGTGAIIGAGSTVTKNIPAGELWVGNPAKRLAKADKKR